MKRIIASSMLFALVTSAAHAAEFGKIYINGQWVKTEKSPSNLGNSRQTNAFLSGIASPLGTDLRKTAVQFLNDNASLLHFNASSAWAPPSVQKGSELETHRIAKLWQGLPVVGGEALVHFTNGKLLFANADDTALDHLSPRARLSATEARNLAFASYSGSAVATDSPKLEVLIVSAPAGREARLAYEVTVRDRDSFSSDTHFIDANRGDELMIRSNVHTVAPRIVLSGAGDQTDFDFDETKWRAIYADQGGCAIKTTTSNANFLSDWWNGNTPHSGSPATCENADPRVMASATAAWNNAGRVYDYYQTSHRRNSIDDRGMPIKSIVNFGGQQFPNAAWFLDKKVMLYGFGDDTKYYDFALPLDVAGHEMTHGITASTAALEYSAEAGALNESYSDVFGKLIAFKNGKNFDWKIGRELFRDGVGFVRDMESPVVGHNRDFQFRGELCQRFNDFCGVHVNSGIPSKAAVLIAKRIGLEKLGKLYYLTLTQLLRSNSTFQDARAQTEAACASLFGQNSEDCRAVSAGFEAVGI